MKKSTKTIFTSFALAGALVLTACSQSNGATFVKTLQNDSKKNQTKLNVKFDELKINTQEPSTFIEINTPIDITILTSKDKKTSNYTVKSGDISYKGILDGDKSYLSADMVSSALTSGLKKQGAANLLPESTIKKVEDKLNDNLKDKYLEQTDVDKVTGNNIVDYQTEIIKFFASSNFDLSVYEKATDKKDFQQKDGSITFSLDKNKIDKIITKASKDSEKEKDSNKSKEIKDIQKAWEENKNNIDTLNLGNKLDTKTGKLTTKFELVGSLDNQGISTKGTFDYATEDSKDEPTSISDKDVISSEKVQKTLSDAINEVLQGLFGTGK